MTNPIEAHTLLVITCQDSGKFFPEKIVTSVFLNVQITFKYAKMCGRSVEYMVQLKLFGGNTFVIEVSQQFKMWVRIGQNKKYVFI